MRNLKFDIYQANTDGSDEKRISKRQVLFTFTKQELKEMSSFEGKVVYKHSKMYWAEEAIDYKTGLVLA